jgi:hypothetical protein
LFVLAFVLAHPAMPTSNKAATAIAAQNLVLRMTALLSEGKQSNWIRIGRAACFMRLSRITRTAVSAGEMKPQLERQPGILR